MATAASYPTDVKTLHFMLDEQRQLIERCAGGPARWLGSPSNGKSIAEIASAHRASLQTVRKQLKIIFAKTGTNRQAQCVGVILRSIATIVGE